jgi:hypothetical protein
MCGVRDEGSDQPKDTGVYLGLDCCKFIVMDIT